MQFSCHSVAAVLTPVQTKQMRINIHKRNNTKTEYKQYKNTVQTTQVHTLPKHTHNCQNTHTNTNPHITKQVKATTVQDITKLNSHNTTKYIQYKTLRNVSEDRTADETSNISQKMYFILKIRSLVCTLIRVVVFLGVEHVYISQFINLYKGNIFVSKKV